MPDQQAAVEAALDALTALHPKKIDLGLERIERVLKALGNPHHKLPPVVHIAGTNGKGSTIAFLKAIAEAEGLKAHVYTSPHLVHFRERIVVGSEEIKDDVLVDVLERVRAANGDEPLSFFEATTAAAFLAFSEHPADICIIEVGLGGRYDATNVIEQPAVVGIAPVDYDHAEFLGRDLAGIAREKAGIMKWHAPIVIGAQRDLVYAVLEAEAAKVNVRPKVWGQDYRAFKQRGGLVYEDDHQVLDLPAPALIGAHQFLNAGLAITIAKLLQFSDDAISAGLRTASWPARLQRLTSGPLAQSIANIDGELWLDGGHNPHAALAVSATMADLESRASRPLILITGILANKDIGGFLDAYAGLAQEVVSVSIPGHASLAPETLAELAKARGLRSAVADDIHSAIDHIITEFNGAESAPRVLICGSLYLAGEVLKLS